MGPEARKRRREKREQKLAEYHQAVEALKATGKLCSNCQHFSHAPIGIKGRICDLDSDSEGYVIKKPDDVCPRHDHVGKPREQT